MAGSSLGSVSTAVPRVGEDTRAGHGLGTVAAVAAACVSHEDSLLLDAVAALSCGEALVDGVLVVEALADRVAFDDLVAHVGGMRGEREDAVSGRMLDAVERVTGVEGTMIVSDGKDEEAVSASAA
jgi:hypothetical protein